MKLFTALLVLSVLAGGAWAQQANREMLTSQYIMGDYYRCVVQKAELELRLLKKMETERKKQKNSDKPKQEGK